MFLRRFLSFQLVVASSFQRLRSDGGGYSLTVVQARAGTRAGGGGGDPHAARPLDRSVGLLAAFQRRLGTDADGPSLPRRRSGAPPTPYENHHHASSRQVVVEFQLLGTDTEDWLGDTGHVATFECDRSRNGTVDDDAMSGVTTSSGQCVVVGRVVAFVRSVGRSVGRSRRPPRARAFRCAWRPSPSARARAGELFPRPPRDTAR